MQKYGRSFSDLLLNWFSVNKRQLPWRETKDPYAIWLSEIILQQTRIQQGMSYWQRFMQKYPTVQMLADASEDEVLRLWQGLGYYSRARNLHTAARQIVEMGAFPSTIDTIRSLKGVGDYTAAAIGSIAFGLPEAVVDGNVYRVLSRCFGIDTPIDSTQGKKTFKSLAQTLLPENASDFNQAMMDFGAIQCTPTSPQCTSCPLIEICVAFNEKRVASLPVKGKSIRIKERHFTYIYIRCKGEVAFHRREGKDIWHGLWEPFLIEAGDLPCFGGTLTLLSKDVKHILTHQIIHADFFLLDIDEKPELPHDYIWINEDEVDNYGVPRLVELLLECIAKKQ